MSTKKKQPSFKDFKEKALKDSEFKAEYEALRPEFEVLKKLVKARKEAHISQADLAYRLHVQQPSIARLERGGYASTSVATLSRVANALGYDLKVSLQAKKRH